MVTARSATVEISWRPCLNFYESGVALLRDFDDSGLLRRFRVENHQVEAILQDDSRLSVGVVAFTLTSAAAPDVTTMADIVTRVIETLKPVDSEVVFHVQHLEPLYGDISYRDACRNAAATWLGPVAQALGLTDTAVLADGVSLVHGLQYQCEFGVVNEEEISARLARDVGRTTGPPRPFGLRLDHEGNPELALFVDSSWFPRESPESVSELTPWVMLKFQQALDEAASLAAAIYDTVTKAEVK